MKITYMIGKHMLPTGKPPILFRCEDCNRINVSGHLARFFYQSRLDTGDLEPSLQAYTDAINNHTVEKLFDNKKIAKKVYKSLCKCKSKSNTNPQDASPQVNWRTAALQKTGRGAGALLRTGGRLLRLRKKKSG